MSNGTVAANGLLDYIVGRAGLMGSAQSRVLRAWTVLPNPAGLGGTEVSGGSYAAVSLVVASHFNTAASGFQSIANTGDISFPAATASWGTVVGVTFHAASGNALLRICPFATPIPVASGQTLRIPAGNLVLTQG